MALPTGKVTGDLQLFNGVTYVYNGTDNSWSPVSSANTLTVGALTSTSLTSNSTLAVTGASTLTGNVGIGTASPSRKLDIEQLSTDYQMRIGDTGGNYYDIGRNTTTGLLTFNGNQAVASGYKFSTVNGDRLTIDTSGNVSIGTVSTSGKLTIQRSAGTSTTPDFYISDGTQWTNINTNSSPGAFNPLVVSGDHSIIYSNGTLDTGAIVIGPWSNNNKGIRIDSSGRVTKPYQPAFFATGSGGTITATVGAYLPFNTLNTTFAGSNRNSGYNASSYVYTAPVAGLYQFYVQLYLNPNSANNSITWWKNGVQMSYQDSAQAVYINTNSGTTPSNIVLSGSVIMELAASDFVGLQVRTSFVNVLIYMGHSSFWGYLIG